ncbi:MAG: SIR2 family protein [Burkholderiales bacterium]|nr:SIR2 family protein [Burkholderiales bacterium]
MPRQQRKIVFFLGAGASVGAGAYALGQGGGRCNIPTQESFWDVFLRFCSSTNNRKDIQSFLFRYFLGYERVPARLGAMERRQMLQHIDVEEVFTFLSERARAPSTSPALRGYAARIWLALVDEVGNVFRNFEPNVKTRSIYRKFVDQMVRSRDTVVSFNYDTVFEGSLRANYEWHYEGIDEKTKSVGIIKPHGSVNWEDGDPVKIKESPDRPLIVAPTHLKFVEISASEGDSSPGYLNHSKPMRNVWAAMEREMREARALVFIGYSFPIADLYFSSVLRSVLADRDGAPGVVIVNPDAVAIKGRLQGRFAIDRIGMYFDIQNFVRDSRGQVLALLK